MKRTAGALALTAALLLGTTGPASAFGAKSGTKSCPSPLKVGVKARTTYDAYIRIHDLARYAYWGTPTWRDSYFYSPYSYAAWYADTAGAMDYGLTYSFCSY